jgi:hypothetical protein
VLTAWTYGARAAAALVRPDRDPRRFAHHAASAMNPSRGEGLAEAAAQFNAGLPQGEAPQEES